PMTRELVPEYWRWEQDPQVIVGYGRQTPESLEARIAGYDGQARNTQRQARFTVYDLTTDGGPRPVGTTALLIDHQVRTAEYIILLGPEGRGRGLAREATQLTLDYAFHVTNLRAVWLKVLEHNTAGVRAYEGAGFKQVGRMRRAGHWLGAECVTYPGSVIWQSRGFSRATYGGRCAAPDQVGIAALAHRPPFLRGRATRDVSSPGVECPEPHRTVATRQPRRHILGTAVGTPSARIVGSGWSRPNTAEHAGKAPDGALAGQRPCFAGRMAGPGGAPGSGAPGRIRTCAPASRGRLRFTRDQGACLGPVLLAQGWPMVWG
ncbi:MAG TPA: GNAT family protein, partial [Jatrophihabitans sp.]|nr:GNAT family protein [Jatrophihabitans sp.]